MLNKSLRIILASLVLIFITAFSCADKEEVNCTVIQGKFLALAAELVSIQTNYTAPDFSNGLDPAECTSYSTWITTFSGKIDEIITLAKKGRSCAFVKDFVKDQGYTEEQLDQYIVDSEEEIKSLKANLASYCN